MDGNFDNITAKSITLKSGDGKSSIFLTSFADGVGIWLTNGDKGVTMYSTPGQECVLALYDTGKQHVGHQYAVSLDKDGVPFLQLVVKGEIKNGLPGLQS